MPLITCDNVSFAYEGQVAISNLHFTIDSGDYLCVLGRNGSGKSTLIKGLLRLIQPVTGVITMGEGLAQNEIGYVPQQTVAQKDFPASAYEVVLSGRLGSRGVKPFYSRIDKEIAASNMERLGVANLSRRCFRELSGGQKQRVLIARALCATKRLIILDEPVSGLDPEASANLYGIISELNKSGLTIVMVSHDMKGAIEHASAILHLDGRQLFFGSTAAYMQSDLREYVRRVLPS